MTQAVSEDTLKYEILCGNPALAEAIEIMANAAYQTGLAEGKMSGFNAHARPWAQIRIEAENAYLKSLTCDLGSCTETSVSYAIEPVGNGYVYCEAHGHDAEDGRMSVKKIDDR